MFQQGVKPGAVVHLPDVAQFMDHHQVHRRLRAPHQVTGKAEAVLAAAAAVPAAPAVPADGLTDEVKVAIMAAIAQQPGFNMANVTNVSIRKI